MDGLDRLNAITFIRPGAEFVITGDKITWLDKKQSEPSEAEIQAGFIAYNAKKANDKATAEAKLAALGLTPEDLKALGLN